MYQCAGCRVKIHRTPAILRGCDGIPTSFSESDYAELHNIALQYWIISHLHIVIMCFIVECCTLLRNLAASIIASDYHIIILL